MERADPHELWEQVLTQVELSISPANFNTWFRDSTIVKVEDGIVSVGVPSQFFRDWYLKKFNTPLTGEQAQMLHRLIDVQRWARPSEREILLGRFSWPVEGFGTPDQILGYSMPRAPLDAYFNLTSAGRTEQKLLQLKYLMDNKYWSGKAITSSKPNINEQDRLEMAIDLVDAIQVIHRYGLIYGDVSSNNMCGRLGGQPSVFLLDADSIVTPDIRARNPVATPGWVTPQGLDPTVIVATTA